jgi:hypothetical protein
MDRRVRFLNITSAATNVVKATPGLLMRVTVNKPVSGSTITVYDNASAASGTKIATITNTSDVKPYFLKFGVWAQNGITVVTSGADDVTVSYA